MQTQELNKSFLNCILFIVLYTFETAIIPQSADEIIPVSAVRRNDESIGFLFSRKAFFKLYENDVITDFCYFIPRYEYIV